MGKNRFFTAVAVAAACAGLVVGAEEQGWILGGDLRVRQEAMDNIPGHPGDPSSPYPTASGKNLNWIRYRPRLWTGYSGENSGFYFRVADEMRETIVRHGKSRKDCSYSFPDEIVVDNLYLYFNGLWDGLVDVKAGRQDFVDGGRPAFGAGRLLMDGTGYDGSRTSYFDALRLTFHLTEKSTLDVFGIYNDGQNPLRLGHPTPSPRAANAIDPRDSDEMDEFGGGLYYKGRELGDDFPCEIYYVFKRETPFHRLGERQPGRDTHTVGARLTPRLSETLTAEFEGAFQLGEKDNGADVSGAMGFAGLTYRPVAEAGSPRPFFNASVYYLSGDSRRGAEDRDTSWNPLWGRWPQCSEMLVYGPLYGLGYWSNMTYPSLGAGLDIAPRHRLNAYAGPMFCAVQDGLGGGDEMYKGLLGVARYDFPILREHNLFGHVLAEVFEPGDYYVTDKTAYFLRWELSVAF